jgi:hypothetical protein
MSAKDIEKFQFKPGESGNPKGRPPKTLTAINKELHSLGYKSVTNAQIKDIYLMLIAMDEGTIQEYIDDSENPMIVRVIGKRLLAKDSFEIIEKLLDRALGKPQQKYDHTTKGEKINNSIDLTQLTDEELEVLERIQTRENQRGKV